MEEQITKRIKQLIKDKGLSNGAFADSIDIKRPIISHILSGRNKPSLHVVLQILQTYPDISPSWLLLGKDEEPKPTAPQIPLEEPAKPVQESKQSEALPSTLLLIEGDQFRIVKQKG